MTIREAEILQNETESLRNRIKSELEHQKMSVQNLADVTGIPKSTIDGFLSRGTNSAYDTVLKICNALNIPIGEQHVEEPARTYTAEYVDDLRSAHKRELELLQGNYDRTIAAMSKAHESEKEIWGKHLADIKKDRAFWRGVSVVLVAVIFVWFIWDITSGTRGLIRYAQGHGLSFMNVFKRG